VAVLKKVLPGKGSYSVAVASYGGCVITAAAAGNLPIGKALVYDSPPRTMSRMREQKPWRWCVAARAAHPSASKTEQPDDCDGFLW